MTKGLLAGLSGLFFNAAAIAAPDRPLALDSEQVEAGRAIYQQYCASCHGRSGEGAPGWREPNEQGDLPPPPHDETGHTWRHSDADLYRMISKGWRDPFNKTESLTMPAFDEILTSEEIRAVITYLKTLWRLDQRRFQWEQTHDRPFPNAGTDNPSIFDEDLK